MEKFRTLKESEIELRVGTVGKTGYTLLLYKNARVDMQLLDEVVGAENWQRDHKEIKGNLYCGVGIYCKDKQQWVWKWDCGTESNTEKEKGEASDSFKRACVNIGIGRELYTSPIIKVSCETIPNQKGGYNLPDSEKFRKFSVKEIEYNDKREITKLVIVDNKGIQVYPAFKIEELEPVKQNSFTDLKCEMCGNNITEKVANYSKVKFGKAFCFNCQKELSNE